MWLTLFLPIAVLVVALGLERLEDLLLTRPRSTARPVDPRLASPAKVGSTGSRVW
jgi:hypothetical protein